MQPRGKRSHRTVTVSALALALAAGTAGIVTEAEARVTRVEIGEHAGAGRQTRACHPISTVRGCIARCGPAMPAGRSA